MRRGAREMENGKRALRGARTREREGDGTGEAKIRMSVGMPLDCVCTG